ncbi:MAG TPA: 4Fe-4S binding protein, partial [Methanocorpusculum sp.]|nr:4Fe-4S binding protein [Methanocorpusculum sp.]
MAMSTMYPKYSKQIEGDTVIMEQMLLKTVSHLRLNTTKCSGCGICSEVCPKNAIILGLVGAVRRGAIKDKAAISVDPAKCSYCGVCTIM